MVCSKMTSRRFIVATLLSVNVFSSLNTHAEASGSCHVQQGASSVGIPTFEGQPQTTYSCIANENCNYDVHILGNYEGNGHLGFRIHHTGNTTVNIRVSGQGSKPIVLVFVSYEPVNWILNIPSGVVIERVLLGSYNLSGSDVSGYTSQSVLNVDRVPYSQLPYAYSSGGQIDEVLSYISGRFGPVASFSGSYRADSWTLNIQQNAVTPGCQGSTPSGTSSPQTTSVPPFTSQEPMTTENDLCSTGHGSRCIEWNNQSICTGDYYTGSSCVGGYCRCVDNPRRDYCTCLYISGECHIERGSSTSVGTPTFEGISQTTYSCVANENCQYDVHVINNYESNGRHGFGIQRTTGRTNVNLRVSGPNEGTKPLILVFVTYEPVTWVLNIPSGVVIERILLGSYYLDDSSVTGYSSQSVLNVERHSYQILPYGDGSDVGGGNTDRLLGYVVGRFGPIASFSGSYRADSWTLDIQRNLLQSDCQQTSDSVTEPVHITTSSIAATNPTPNSNSEISAPVPDSSCSSSDRCIGSSGYCSGGYTFRPTCVNGYCRCSNVPNRDYCTCLSIIGSCHITKDNSTALGTPTFTGQSQTTYSCVANDNCRYNVHVIGNYESNGRHGFGIQRTTGRTNVNLRVSGPNEGKKPLILVFVSYEPVTWILSIPSGVIIEKILLGSYYLDDSSVTGYSSQSVLNVERLPYQTLPYGIGSDVGGGRTDELLDYVIGRFGPVASFSGSYRADSWTLNIQQSLFQSDCQQPEISRPGSESISQVIGDIQLSNGCSGELQMYESLQSGEGWYSVCESSFSEANSKVVCRNLGCSIDGATSTMRVSHSFLPSLRAHIYCYGYESSFSHCELTNMTQCSSSQSRLSVHIECSNNTGKYQVSALAGGIAVGVIAFVGCIFALFIGVVCYKKGVYKKSAPRPSRLIRNNTYPTTCVTPAAPSGTQHLYQQPQHPYQLQPSNIHSTSTTLEEPSHLKAATHAGEAPPAYHAAMHYETVILEDNKDLKLSENSALYRAKPSPPTYSEIISGQEDNLVNHE